MEASYNYPQDDYALTILTQAAMHTRTTDSSTSGYDNPTSLTAADLQGSLTPTTSITNHQTVSGHRDSKGIQSHSQSRNPENNYNHLKLPLSTARMETLAFNPSQAARHHPYMDSAIRGIVSEISRNYANNLGILNAESYPENLPSRGFDEGKQNSEPGEPTLSFGLVPRPHRDPDSREDTEEPDMGTRRRKKPRIEVHSGDDDEEARKKSRGRPRVDTKDETAADVSEDYSYHHVMIHHSIPRISEIVWDICLDEFTWLLFFHDILSRY